MTQTTIIPNFAGSLVMSVLLVSSAHGQLFGPRTFGQSLSRRAGPRLSANTGTIRGNERFLRSNRRSTDFVGSDRSDSTQFVGTGSPGRGTAPSAVDVLRPPSSTARSSLNRPLQAPQNGMYHPKLTLAPADRAGSTTGISGESLTLQLSGFLDRKPDARISVSVEGRTAVLRGEVASELDRDLVERIVGFEPAIVAIRNLLRVAPARELQGEAAHPPLTNDR